MTRPMRFSSWPIALLIAAGCAPQSDFSAVSTSPVTMMCDGGQTFTVAYANNFETAVVETEGKRLELPRLRTALSMMPRPPESSTGSPAAPFHTNEARGIGGQQGFGRPRGGHGVAGSTGVRYGNEEALFISRNQGAVLEIGDDTYSNCQVART
jgi:hypothetical protein